MKSRPFSMNDSKDEANNTLLDKKDMTPAKTFGSQLRT